VTTHPYNLARFDMVSIQLAVACARTGSLTAAARDSHLALAAASRRIRDLEAALGGPLFERHARGLTATPAGKIFAKHGLILLQQMGLLSAELSDLQQGVARHIRLWASTAAISQFLPPLLAAYSAALPQVRIDLEEQVSEVVVASLRDGRADVGIWVEGPATEGLDSQLFAHDELVLVLPAGHRLATARSAIDFADTLAEDYIGLNTGAAMLVRQQQTAQALGLPLKLRMQVRSFDAVCHLVASGLGIAILPQAAAWPIMQSMQLASRSLTDGWARRRLLVATRAGEADAGILDFVRFLAEAGPERCQTSQKAKALRRKKQ
jgi:DNA-binding transcriptional LysR family regulator